MFPWQYLIAFTIVSVVVLRKVGVYLKATCKTRKAMIRTMAFGL
jgi:hypothetical protein